MGDRDDVAADDREDTEVVIPGVDCECRREALVDLDQARRVDRRRPDPREDSLRQRRVPTVDAGRAH